MTHDPAHRHAPGFATLAVHAGAQPDPATGTRAMPADQAASPVFDDADPAAALFGLRAEGDGFLRLADPTVAMLEERVAALEGGTAAVAVASGRAARAVAFHALMEPGDEFIASTELRDSSADQFEHAFGRFGWAVRWADPADPAAFEALVTERTRAIFVEVLPDPDGAIADIEAIAGVARRARVPLIVDNTLTTPCLFRPLDHGADIVVHSATGALCGRGDAAGGVIVDGGRFDWTADGRFPSLCRPRPECGGVVLGEAFGNFAFAVACRALGLRDLGPALSRLDASVILAGIETLPLRMRRQCDNALEVASFLAEHPAVARVSYPGLPDDPRHGLARRRLPRGAGAVLAFGLRGGGGAEMVGRLKLFSRLAPVGGTRSLAVLRASTAPRRPTGEGGAASGAGPNPVILSVGIEDAADLIADLGQALAAAGAGTA